MKILIKALILVSTVIVITFVCARPNKSTIKAQYVSMPTISTSEKSTSIAETETQVSTTVQVTSKATETTTITTTARTTTKKSTTTKKTTSQTKEKSSTTTTKRQTTTKATTTSTSTSKRNNSSTYYSGSYFRRMGVIHWNGYRWTWYSQKVLPGGGLRIPGRHVDEQGYVCDENDYICLASSTLSKGTILSTPFGKSGKIYDSGCAVGTVDVYVNW